MNQPPLYYPNSNPQPVPGQFYNSPVPPPPPSKKYSKRLVSVLSIVYGIAWILCFIGEAATNGQPNFLFNFGISLFFGILAFVLIKDWQGGVTLQGLIKWQKRKTPGRIIIGFLCILFFPFLLAVYLVRTFSLFKRIPQAGSQGAKPVRNRRTQVALVVGSLATLLVLLFASIGNSAASQSTSSADIAPTGTRSSGQISPATPTVNPPKATPTIQPTKVPPVAPTIKPQPTQPKPTPKPQIFLTFTNSSAVDYSNGSVSVHTQPGAALTITVTYCTGYKAVSDSLKGTSYADGGGNHKWTWTPETKCRGEATADVTANWNGQFVEQTGSFTVQ